MNKMTSLAATLLALGGMAAAASGMAAPAAPDAPPPPRPPHGMRHHGPEAMFDKLGLSAEQKAKAKAIMEAKGPQMKKLHEQIRANMEKLHGVKPDDPTYSEVVSQVAQENGALTTQAISAQGDMRAQMYQLLTPAQKQQLSGLESKMREHMKKAGKRWGPHGMMMGPMGDDGPEGPQSPAPPDAPPPPR